VKQDFISGAEGPCGVAVYGGQIYWGNQHNPTMDGTTIGRANLDGTGVNQRFITDGTDPCGFAFDR